MRAGGAKPPTVLGIETATGVCGVAVAEGSVVKGEAVLNVGLSHSSRLLELVGRVLADTSVEIAQLDAIAVSVGPGSFTGVRIGVGTALGLAEGAGLPVVPVPTLDALVWAQRPFEGMACGFVDARRGEVYYCLYDVNWNDVNRLGDYTVEPPSEMLAKVGREMRSRPSGTAVLLAGPQHMLDKALDRPVSEPANVSRQRSSHTGDEGAPRGLVSRLMRDGLIPKTAQVLIAPEDRAAPKPAAVAVLGACLCRKGMGVALKEVKPIYVRRSDAELRGKKTGTA